MNRTASERASDVKRLLRAARALVASSASIVPSLVASTGLSREGVELALARHLETEASDEDVRKLVERAGNASRVTVVLSSNVFVGALRAIALARAASADVVVRPSRRDPAFAQALVSAAVGAGDTHLRLVEDLDVSSVEHGEIHVYGRDETIARVRADARVNVRVCGHGSGLGVAWISAEARLSDAADSLAADIVAFDQRGCMSPRIALVHGGETRALEFAQALDHSLAHLGVTVPRGSVPREEQVAIRRYVATMTYACRAIEGEAHVIGLGPSGAPLLLPPPYRTLHVTSCASMGKAASLLSPFANGILVMGSDDAAAARRLAPSWARVCAVGSMQRPPFDGPVDLRTPSPL